MFNRSRHADNSVTAAQRLYESLVARARAPIFHTGFAVPDTIDGRFDLLAVHAFLVMRELRGHGAGAERLGTGLATLIFAGFDDALRELGVGDFGISRRIKAMADAFYGRLEAYGAARRGEALADALLRNLYRGDERRMREAAALAHYMLSASRHLQARPESLLAGELDFGPLPQL